MLPKFVGIFFLFPCVLMPCPMLLHAVSFKAANMFDGQHISTLNALGWTLVVSVGPFVWILVE